LTDFFYLPERGYLSAALRNNAIYNKALPHCAIQWHREPSTIEMHVIKNSKTFQEQRDIAAISQRQDLEHLTFSGQFFARIY
jgi:superfamily II helicase